MTGFQFSSGSPPLRGEEKELGEGKWKPGDKEWQAKWGCAWVGGGEAELELESGRQAEAPRGKEEGLAHAPRSVSGAKEGPETHSGSWSHPPAGALLQARGRPGSREAGALARLLVGLEEVDRPLLTQSDRAETPVQRPGVHKSLKPFQSRGSLWVVKWKISRGLSDQAWPSRAPCWPAVGPSAPELRGGGGGGQVSDPGKPYRGNLEA